MNSQEEILQQTCNLSAEDIELAQEYQLQKGGSIGEILVQQKKISSEDLLRAYSLQYDMDLIQKIPYDLNPFFTDRVSIGFLKKFKMIPVATPNDSFVAMAEPAHFQQLDDLLRTLHWEGIKTVLAPQNLILMAINYSYDQSSQNKADQVMQDIDEENPEAFFAELEGTTDLLDDTSDAPVIKLVNLILSLAVRDNASDIHIESHQNKVKIRERIDGILYDMYSPPKHVQAKLISRVKIMAKLDIAEKRLPQDGRIEIRIADRNIDIRVSTLPTAFGERVVMRLLDKSSVLLSLNDIGMSSFDMRSFKQLITKSHGIILVTGPTGSGKTTTLYSALSSINKPDINIITVEDPIEYQIEGISQVQVNPKINLTFANGLRTIVRQDPDVILVGEIRDRETAEIAIQASLTGHLVFSTLHTNDAASSVTRLTDMGIESFLITSSVNAILAQRLVRKICDNCKQQIEPDNATLSSIGLSRDRLQGERIFHGAGCSQCFNTGYIGRVGIFELMMMSDTLRRLIVTTSDAGLIKSQAIKEGMTTLREDGIRKILSGITTIEEVFRVTQE